MGEGPKEGHEDDPKAGEPALGGKTGAVRSFHLRKEGSGGNASQYSSNIRAAAERMEALSS